MRNLLQTIIVVFLLMTTVVSSSQIVTNYAVLKKLSKEMYLQEINNRKKVLEFLKQRKMPVKIINDSLTIEVQFIDKYGNPQYLITNNANAAKTISTDKVFSGGGAGFNLDGAGVTLREWDAGVIRKTHQEFGGRVSNQDAVSVSGHSTHVAGTMIASGVTAAAKGMAPAASLRSFDWNNMNSEMANEAANGALISNHSYGYLRGWNGCKWWGDTTISKVEDYKFGFYDETSRAWDEIAYNAPYYLIVKSSGNDRNDDCDTSVLYPPDGPYDCIDQLGISKNILTVGAVNDISGGYTQPSDVVMTSFSSWGPADDGRIKPDIVANGTGLYSTYYTADNAYASMTGTSMSSPSVAGSLALLIQHYEDVFGSGKKMRASTLKALVINTANEAGTDDGPDYSFGWGLMNTEKAALKISQDDTLDVISEKVLDDGNTYSRYIKLKSANPIRITLVWTDPPGNPPAKDTLDPDDPAIINDLDLVLEDTTDKTFYYPWKLDRDNPSVAATTGVNDVDNVEQVDIAVPDSGHVYKISVSHKNSLENGSQAFSLIIEGDFDSNEKPVADFYASITEAGTDQTVQFFDASDNIPESWSWTFSPNTIIYVNGTDSTSKDPIVQFQDEGTYTVTLKVINLYGDSTIIKSDYIKVKGLPGGYCEAYSENPWGYVKNVSFCSIDNNSTYTNAGGGEYYEDFTTVSTKVVRGQRRKLTVVNSVTDSIYTPYLDAYVWIDWNRDGDFFDSGEMVVSDPNNGGGGTYVIDIPVSARLGKTIMRVRTHYDDEYEEYSCNYTSYGEVEDYTLEIVNPSPVTWTGNVSTDWNDANNWDTGSVPNFTNDVTIPSLPAGSNFPVLPAGAKVGVNSITLESGASLNLTGTVNIFGME